MARRDRAHAVALALVVMLPAACRDDEPAAPPVDVKAEPEPREPEPPEPPRRSLARRIAPLLEAPVARAPAPPAERQPDDDLGLRTVGIEECDEYLRQSLRCMEHSMPEGSLEPFRDALAQSADAWAEAAKNPGAVEALRSACETASEAMRSSMAGMGCTWE